MPTIVIPVGIDFLSWSAQIQQDLPDIVIPLATDLSGWWDWANQLISTNELWNVPLATKITFPREEDWAKWAKYFVETINLT
jgi:hypothetical protein